MGRDVPSRHLKKSYYLVSTQLINSKLFGYKPLWSYLLLLSVFLN